MGKKNTFLVLFMIAVLWSCAAAADASQWVTPQVGAMTERAEAVDDFFCHVNYDWAQTAVIEPGKTSVSSFSELDNANRDKTIALLGGEKAKSRDAQQAQILFGIMTDMDARNEAGIAPLVESIKEIEQIGTMDALNAYLLDPKKPQSLMVAVGMTLDFADSTLNVALIGQSDLSLGDSAEYQSRTDHGTRVEAAKRYVMGEMYAHMGRTKEEGEALYDQALAMEEKIAPLMYTTADAGDPSYFGRIYNVYDWEELDSLQANFPLKAFLESRGVEHSPFFIVMKPDFHVEFDAMYTQENLEGFKAMMICSQVIGCAGMLDQRSMDIIDEANAMISGSTGKLPIEEKAYSLLTDMLPGCLGQLYVENCFTEEVRKDVEGIIDQVIAVYRRRLENNDWLSETTREKAIEKLDGMSVNVGCGEKWADYSGLEISPEMTYYDAMQAYGEYVLHDLAQTVGTRVDPLEWDMPTHIPNAGYNPQNNSINIFAGILGEPFYTPGGSVEANLGGIGTVVGHEITHAFDAKGSQFDVHGNMVNWWTQEDYVAFMERSGKVADYFSAIEVIPGVKTNGVMMQGEAVADLGGVSAMLEIAKDIEDFDYKVFFEAYASIWCEQCTRERIESRLLSDPHPTNHLRTNITLQQFDEFYETYGVKEGDGMYLAPQDRLSVW